MVSILEEVVGEKITLKEMTMEEFDKAKDTMWAELWLNYKVQHRLCIRITYSRLIVVLPLSR